MGSSQLCSSVFSQYNTEYQIGSIKIVSNKKDSHEKYLIKSYTTTSLRQQNKKFIFFSHYQAYMRNNQQTMRIVRIIDEQDQHFCSSSHKIHLVFEYSPFTLSQEIKERQNNLNRITNEHSKSLAYFQYQDLCNILYSCLSALWMTKEYCKQQFIDDELQRYSNMFISPQNILIFGQGIIKIMDPFVIGYKNRYVFTQNIYYSPQKMAHFSMIDDEKCCIFELGMTMLQLSTLQILSLAYQNRQFCIEPILSQLKKARQIYSLQLQRNPDLNIFNLIENMIKTSRMQRFDLHQTVDYAQKMYQKQLSNIQQINQSIEAPKTAKNDNSNQKQNLNNTNYSSNDKKSSNLKKFKSFKNSIIQQRNDQILILNSQSPKISHFAMNQNDLVFDCQNMPQSVKQDNPTLYKCANRDNIFSNISLNYSFSKNQQNNFSKSSTNLQGAQQIFTDPQLMKTIDKQMKVIKSRKHIKTGRQVATESITKKSKPNINFKITNQIYLR